MTVPHTICDRVAEAAATYPDAPALAVSSGRVMSHRALREQVVRAARFLNSLQLDRSVPIALLADHRIESIVALLAILEAGHSYTPFDPRWPHARLVSLAETIGVECVFADGSTSDAAELLALRAPRLSHVVRLDVAGPDWVRSTDRAQVRALWDEVASSADWAEAAGFGTFDEATAPGQWHLTASRYFARVQELAMSALGDQAPSAKVLDVGCGTGELAALIAPRVASYVGVDPSGTAVKRLLARFADGGNVQGAEGFAHALPDVGRDFDLAVFSSVCQFFPSCEYLVTAIRHAAERISFGGKIILADLIDPDLESHAGLRLPPSFFAGSVKGLSSITGAHVLYRETGEGGHQASRYDVVLTCGPIAAIRPNAVRRWTSSQVQSAGASLTEPRPEPGDIAYVIFTSGSTGRPKGVVVTHDPVVRLIDWVNSTFQVGPGDILLQVTAFSFDLSVYDVFGILAAGACLRLMTDEELFEPGAIARTLVSETITFWDSAPAAMDRVLPAVASMAGKRDHLRLVFLSGDWIPLSMPDRIRAEFQDARVVSLGGATEATVWSNFYSIDRIDSSWPSIPYGIPIPHAHYAVLDDALVPCGPETAGDLYIGGDCLALGYLDDAKQTAERFLPDPFALAPGQRMYRTGDRAMLMTDGNLRFLGRVDDQVKINGYRIELGEVQAQLSRCTGVQSCAVVPVSNGLDRRLVAFYVPDGTGSGAGSRSGSVRENVLARLRRELPRYMVPAELIPVAGLPVSANGKVDRTALVNEAGDRLTWTLRRRLIRAWCDLLGKEPGTIDENLLDAGADSFLIAGLLNLIEIEFNVHLEFEVVWQSALTIRSLSALTLSTLPPQRTPHC